MNRAEGVVAHSQHWYVEISRGTVALRAVWAERHVSLAVGNDRMFPKTRKKGVLFTLDIKGSGAGPRPTGPTDLRHGRGVEAE